MNALDLLGGQGRAEAKRVCAGRERAHGRVLDSLEGRRRPASPARRSSRHRRSRARCAAARPRPSSRSPAPRRRRRSGCARSSRRAPRPRPRRRTAGARARAGGRGRASEDGSSRCESATVSPWPGKCLAQAATPTLWRPSTKAATWRATTCRVGAERAHADDRARRVDQHVGDRREVEVDPDGRQLAADRRPHAPRQRGVVDRRRARSSRETSSRSRPRAASRRRPPRRSRRSAPAARPAARPSARPPAPGP